MFKTKKLIVSMCGILLAVLLFISLTAANRASYAEEMGQAEMQDKFFGKDDKTVIAFFITVML